MFFAPEVVGGSQSGIEDGLSSVESYSVVRRAYFAKLYGQSKSMRADADLVSLVIAHARGVISQGVRKQRFCLTTLSEEPFGELALEETLENTFDLSSADRVLVEKRTDARFCCTLMLDCSSSMAGEKHLLGSIAVAIVVLQQLPHDIALVSFASRSELLKRLNESATATQIVLKFLTIHPKGFTDIASGLSMGAAEASRGRFRTGMLVTDGRTTEGADPVEAAKGFDNLVVLHLCGAGSDFKTSCAIARAGGGTCIEVEQICQLPRRMYDAFRLLMRRAR